MQSEIRRNVQISATTSNVKVEDCQLGNINLSSGRISAAATINESITPAEQLYRLPLSVQRTIVSTIPSISFFFVILWRGKNPANFHFFLSYLQVPQTACAARIRYFLFRGFRVGILMVAVNRRRRWLL